MSRANHRRQVPKGARRRSPVGKGTHVGQPDPVDHMQLQSVARRFARCDRHQAPLHCHVQNKLMYDSREVAKSTGQALQRLARHPYYLYRCPTGNHWHLTTNATGEAVA